MGLLISNAAIFTNAAENRLLTGQAVAIQGNLIQRVGPEQDLQAQFAGYERLDGAGRLLMPGLTNVHMHFYGTFARGLALQGTPRSFVEILEQLWWRLDRSLDLEAVYYSALVSAITAVKNGCTSVIDHHASPQAVEGSLDRIEQALAMVGMRGLLCYEVSDRDGKGVRDRGLEENARYIRHCRQRRSSDPNHPFDGMLGLHAAFTLDDDSLEQAAELCQSLQKGCHIHLLEDRADQDRCLQKYGAGALDRLHRFGLLGEGSIAAHGIHLDPAGMEVIASTGTIVTHQAQSNMNNAVGRADVFELLRRGVTVGIGTDGMTPDLRAEARTGYLLQKHHLGDCNAGWAEFEQMTLKNNPEIYRRLTGQPVGRIEPGALADLILIDYYPPTPLTEGNIWGHFLYGIIDAAVHTVVIGGKIVMQDKRLPHLDEAQIAAASRVCAEKVWQRFHAKPPRR
ncbi:MAG: putative aminohydrolase SsnA [Acidobacteriota bacterium]